MTPREFTARLARRCRRAGVSVDDRLLSDLVVYFQLLATWNARINLTGLDLSDPAPEVIDRLFVEPIVAARFAAPRTARVMDIGSGGGSPALPFALALGGVRLRMVESKIRKSVFLREAIRTLRMPDAEVLNSRYEDLIQDAYRSSEDLLTVRAVRVDAQLLSAAEWLVRPGGQVFLFTGAEFSVRPDWPATLRFAGAVPLVDSLGSSLTILHRERQNVPRGTSA